MENEAKAINLLTVRDLPLYDTKSRVKKPKDDPPVGFLQENICSVRRFTWSYLKPIKNVYHRSVQMYETGKAHSLATVAHIRSDPAVLARVGVISVAGFSGIIAGYRGGAARKLVYGGVAGGTVAALCYPKEAVNTFHYTRNNVPVMLDKFNNYMQPPETSIKIPRTPKVSTPITDDNASPLEDHGQSLVEDKDMYTTRTS